MLTVRACKLKQARLSLRCAHAQAVAQSMQLYNVASQSALSCAGPRHSPGPGATGVLWQRRAICIKPCPKRLCTVRFNSAKSLNQLLKIGLGPQRLLQVHSTCYCSFICSLYQCFCGFCIDFNQGINLRLILIKA